MPFTPLTRYGRDKAACTAPEPQGERPCAPGATMIAATVFFWTTGTSAFARRPFPFPCSTSGSALLSCPLTKNCMQISTPRRTGGIVKCAARPLLQAQTASNTARTAESEYSRRQAAECKRKQRLLSRSRGDKALM